MEWMIMPLKRYADFSGRSRRLEDWMFVLFLFLLLFAAILIVGIAASALPADSATGETLGAGFIIVGVLVYLALLIPMIAVQVRRFHDQDLSGWFVLLNLIPYLGGLIVLIFMFIDGTPGPNRFGDDPKGRGETLANVFS